MQHMQHSVAKPFILCTGPLSRQPSTLLKGKHIRNCGLSTIYPYEVSVTTLFEKGISVYSSMCIFQFIDVDGPQWRHKSL